MQKVMKMTNNEYKELVIELVNINISSMNLIRELMEGKENDKNLIRFNDCLIRILKRSELVEDKLNRIIG